MKDDPILFWQHVHGASSHFPIAMMVASLFFDFGALVLRRRDAVQGAAWRHVAFWTLLIAAAVSVPTILSGLAGQLGWFGIKPWDAERMVLHRNVALIAGGFVIAMAIWRTARRDRLAGGEFAAYLAILLLASIGIGYTGYLGAYVARGY